MVMSDDIVITLGGGAEVTTHHGTHNDLHSERGALRAEHPGRAKNPVIKVLDLAWLEFVKPDLAASERFAHAFGFTTVSRTTDELQLRGTDAGAPCVWPDAPLGTRGVADPDRRTGASHHVPWWSILAALVIARRASELSRFVISRSVVRSSI